MFKSQALYKSRLIFFCDNANFYSSQVTRLMSKTKAAETLYEIKIEKISTMVKNIFLSVTAVLGRQYTVPANWLV